VIVERCVRFRFANRAGQLIPFAEHLNGLRPQAAMDSSDSPPSAAASEPLAVSDHIATPPLIASPVSQPSPPEKFHFHGDAREYFRIWIVNTLLTVLSLGAFSAWAKVRKRRYLRGNTELLGHRFDYTADPKRILIGNLMVLSLFVTYGLFGAVYPALRLLALALAVIFLPWIIVRSLAFNAHHTMWRGLRFRFHPSLSAAVMVYLLKPLLIPLSLGFYYPAWARDKAEFRISRHRFGTAYFHFGAGNGPFYKAHLFSALIVAAGAIALGLWTTFLTMNNSGHVPTNAQLIPGFLAYGAFLLLAKNFAFARLFNPIWNATRLNDHVFHANLKTSRWLSIQLTNLVAIVATCGLLYPWALIRSTRYALSCLEVELAPGFETISRVGSSRGSAVGDSAAEFAGFDFGL
jgi:uncharacterized membrane protein YjgN (DUF898 family)